MTIDMKPELESEKLRIEKAGGYTYQSPGYGKSNIVPPVRVFPGKLSVSRAFGDWEAKDPFSGGNPKVIICEPEVLKIPLSDQQKSRYCTYRM